MAILEGIEVLVVIAGKALTEYDDEEAADKSHEHASEVSKYIEAVSDAEFGIDITVPSSYDFAGDAISFKLTLDGVSVRGRLCRKAKIKRLRVDWHTTIAGSKVKNGKNWYLKPFKFNDINIGKTSLHILIICIDREIQLKRQLHQLAAGRATVSQNWGPSHWLSLTEKLPARLTVPAGRR